MFTVTRKTIHIPRVVFYFFLELNVNLNLKFKSQFRRVGVDGRGVRAVGANEVSPRLAKSPSVNRPNRTVKAARERGDKLPVGPEEAA